ncbi:MAG TPA: M23 family metallopeptidase [Chitinophagaceae bacterium]|nr:M23 family metallopeptidase [Chitinophagaceae bacterium]
MKRTPILIVIALAIFSSAFASKNPTPEVSKSLVFPVSGKKSNIGSFWGDVRDGGRRKHQGIDIFARKGTPVLAIADGIIVSKGNTPRGGKTLWLQPVGYPWTVYYAHLDQQKVKEGQFVKKGEVLGTVGNTGNARYTPAHLHFGIYTWIGAVNPLPYVKYSPRIVSPLAKPAAKQAPLVKVSKPKPIKQKPNVATVAAFPRKYVMKTISISADPGAQYYVTTRSNVVRVHNGKVQVVGKWNKANSNKYPYRITLANNKKVFVKPSGKLITAEGVEIGKVS